MDLCPHLVVRKRPELAISTEAEIVRTIRLRTHSRGNVTAGIKLYNGGKGSFNSKTLQKYIICRGELNDPVPHIFILYLHVAKLYTNIVTDTIGVTTRTTTTVILTRGNLNLC